MNYKRCNTQTERTVCTYSRDLSTYSVIERFRATRIGSKANTGVDMRAGGSGGGGGGGDLDVVAAGSCAQFSDEVGVLTRCGAVGGCRLGGGAEMMRVPALVLAEAEDDCAAFDDAAAGIGGSGATGGTSRGETVAPADDDGDCVVVAAAVVVESGVVVVVVVVVVAAAAFSCSGICGSGLAGIVAERDRVGELMLGSLDATVENSRGARGCMV
jgi:hypothetical protein